MRGEGGRINIIEGLIFFMKLLDECIQRGSAKKVVDIFWETRGRSGKSREYQSLHFDITCVGYPTPECKRYSVLNS